MIDCAVPRLIVPKLIDCAILRLIVPKLIDCAVPEVVPKLIDCAVPLPLSFPLPSPVSHPQRQASPTQAHRVGDCSLFIRRVIGQAHRVGDCSLFIRRVIGSLGVPRCAQHGRDQRACHRREAALGDSARACRLTRRRERGVGRDELAIPAAPLLLAAESAQLDDVAPRDGCRH